MPNVVRFTLSTARDLNIPGAGRFIAGVLDVDANDLKLLARTRYLVDPYNVTEVGIVDSATPKPSLPAVPVAPPVDPYPQYVTDADIANPASGPMVALRAAFVPRLDTLDDLPATGVTQAHRLGMKEAPENCRSAARIMAARHHLLEVDGFLTADGIVIIHHDTTLDRETDGTGAPELTTYAQTPLRDVAASSPNPSERLGDGWAAEEAMTFAELLDIAHGRSLVSIEPKNSASGTWEATLAAIHRTATGKRRQGQVLINTTNMQIVTAARNLGYEVVGWGIETDTAKMNAMAAAGVRMVYVEPTISDANLTLAKSLFEWLIVAAESRSIYAQQAARGMHGFSSNAPEYALSTTMVPSRSLAQSIARGRTRAAILSTLDPNVASNPQPVYKGQGLWLRGNRRLIPELCGTKPATYTIRTKGTVVTAHSNSFQKVARVRFEVSNDTTIWSGGDNVDGYEAYLRGSGVLECRVITGGVSTIVGTLNTPALTAGTNFEFTVTVTPTGISLARIDQAASLAEVANAAHRGKPFLWLGQDLAEGQTWITALAVE